MTRWKWAAISGGIGAILLLALAASQEQKAGRPAPDSKKESFEVGLPTAQEVRGMVGAYGQRIEETERNLGDLKGELTRTRSVLENALRSLMQPPVRPEEAPRAPESPRVRIFEFAGSKKGASVHIPAGSFGEATLLTGVFAPTNGDPLPVLLRLDAALIGPHKTRLPLPRALLVGKAVGDANSRRATIQIDSLSVATAGGKTQDVKTNGWVVDADGIQGLRGVYVWRADEIAGLSAVTGALSAGSEAFAARETTQAVSGFGATSAVTGDPLRLAEFKALGGAASKLSEMFAERLKEIVPAIHVTNGKNVTVAFVTGVTLEGLTPEEVNHASNGDPYRGLDVAR